MSCPVSNEKLEIEFIIIFICSFLSAIGSLLIIIPYFIMSKMRSYSFRIMFYISVSDLIRAVTFCIPFYIVKNNTLCHISAYLLHVSIYSTLIWTEAISITIFKVFKNSQEDFTKDFKFWMGLTFFSFLVSTVPIFLNKFDYFETYCFYQDSTEGNLFKIFMIYIPVWLSILISIVCYLKIYNYSNDLQIDDSKTTTLKRLMLYPLILIIIYSPLLILRIIEFVVGSCPLQIYVSLAIYLFCLHGFFNSCAYIWNFKLLQNLKEYFQIYYRRKDQKYAVNTINSTSTNLLFQSF